MRISPAAVPVTAHHHPSDQFPMMEPQFVVAGNAAQAVQNAPEERAQAAPLQKRG
jgi:hypothetical protein